MKIPQYQVDAFANNVFEGNPAAICPLDDWLDDDVMQAIAAENNLAETAFFVQQGQANQYRTRWFTPTVEVNLCGHATLASAFVLFSELGVRADTIEFDSLSGVLTVERDGDRLKMDFPAQQPQPVTPPNGLEQALGVPIKECLYNEDYVVVLGSEQAVRELQPDLNLLANIKCRGVIVTAQSEHYDFVCRFFGPRIGIEEDPVTGSAFTKLTPYWASQLGKVTMHAKQVSSRGGEVFCEINQDRVIMSGYSVLFAKGDIFI